MPSFLGKEACRDNSQNAKLSQVRRCTLNYSGRAIRMASLPVPAKAQASYARAKCYSSGQIRAVLQ
eukprot:1655873-Pleurochrysis_carterae.AAC.2